MIHRSGTPAVIGRRTALTAPFVDLGLSGKTAVVTGASKGIGLAITRALAAEGASVAAGARSAGPELSELAERSGVLPVQLDLTTPDGPTRLVEQAVHAFGGWTSWSTTSGRCARGCPASSP